MSKINKRDTRTMLMVTSVNKTPEDEIDSETSFHFCN